jgi:hypothetical protein
MDTGSIAELLRSRTSGAVITPEDERYQAARRIWNHDIDRRPAVILRAASEADVAATVRLAGDYTGGLAVRGGGHSFPGHSACEGGIVLDLGALNEVAVDPARRRARVGGGALLRDLDRANQEHGLVTPAGVVSHTGVGGLTLGGGYGYLSRRLALSCDSLRSVRLVTATGEVLVVDDEADPELMWGLRGGGGNFGVVTEFDFDCHPQGPVLTGWLLWPYEIVREFLDFYSGFVTTMPEDMCLPVRILVDSNVPILPPELRGSGRSFVGLRIVWGGDHAEGRAAIEALRRWRPPVVDSVEVTDYRDLQRSIDGTSRHGLGRYAKAGYLMELTEPLVDGVLDRLAAMPTPACEVILFTLGGAVARVGEQDTAYSSRQATFMYEVRTAWEPGADPGERAACVSWVQETWAVMDKFAMEGVYVNLVQDEGEGRIRKAYGEGKFQRLRALKSTWDPTNLFRLNQNIPPL